MFPNFQASVESNEEILESESSEQVPEAIPSPLSGQDEEISVNIKKEPEESNEEELEVKKEVKMEVDTTEPQNDENEVILPIKEEDEEEKMDQQEEEPEVKKENEEAEEAEGSVLQPTLTEQDINPCIEKGKVFNQIFTMLPSMSDMPECSLMASYFSFSGSEDVEEETVQEEPAIKQEEEEESEMEEKSDAIDPSEDQSDSKTPEKTIEEEPSSAPVSDTTSAIVSCLIDGNLELSQAPTALPSVPNRIKINISKPILTKPTDETEDESDKASESEHEDQASVSEHVPAGEEPVVSKPKLVGRKLTVLPPKVRGTETSGLCSIM